MRSETNLSVVITALPRKLGTKGLKDRFPVRRYPYLGYPTIGFIPIVVTRSVHHPAYQALLMGLVEARKNSGVHQAQLAQRLGRPQSFVSKFENGERRLDVVEFVVVCKALAVEPASILKQVIAALAAGSPRL